MNRCFATYACIIFTYFWMFTPTFAWADSAQNVVVSIAPQKYFVETIGGKCVEVTVIVNPGHSPADYEPTPSQMVGITRADIYFSVGVPFEAVWLKKFSGINPAMKVIHTDADIEKKPINRYEIIDFHDNHRDHDQLHSHSALDPHIWLSPPLVKTQAEHILNGLILIDPDNTDYYKNNYLNFLDQIDQLDKEATSLLADKTRRDLFLVFHPSWGYFADAYGLKQISIEIEGKTPKARDVKHMIEFARKRDIRLIFVQPQFSTKQAEIIAKEINGQLIYADPLAEDWYENIRTMALSLKQALK